MVPGESPLGSRRRRGGTNGAVSGELNGGTLDKGAGRHDDLAVIARHIPGHGGGEAVYGSCSLDAPAESHHGLLAAQLHSLNDVVAAFPCAGDAAVAKGFVEVGCKDSAFSAPATTVGGQEKPLVQLGHQPQIGPPPPGPGRGQRAGRRTGRHRPWCRRCSRQWEPGRRRGF